MVKDQLKELGLSNEEINIYLALLKLGSSKATILSKELSLARTTIYRFLASLQNKGLISENIQNNVSYFYPTNPKRIPEILKEKMQAINKIIPELNNLYTKLPEETSVKLFKGKEGIKTVMKDIIRESKNYTLIGEAKKYFEELDMDIFSTQWIKQIEKKKIKGELLCSKEQEFKVAKTESYKLLPSELIPEISTWTYGNKTALLIWTKPFHAVVINNKHVTESNRKMFNYLWKVAKRPTKKHLQKTKL